MTDLHSVVYNDKSLVLVKDPSGALVLKYREGSTLSDVPPGDLEKARQFFLTDLQKLAGANKDAFLKKVLDEYKFSNSDDVNSQISATDNLTKFVRDEVIKKNVYIAPSFGVGFSVIGPNNTVIEDPTRWIAESKRLGTLMAEQLKLGKTDTKAPLMSGANNKLPRLEIRGIQALMDMGKLHYDAGQTDGKKWNMTEGAWKLFTTNGRLGSPPGVKEDYEKFQIENGLAKLKDGAADNKDPKNYNFKELNTHEAYAFMLYLAQNNPQFRANVMVSARNEARKVNDAFPQMGNPGDFDGIRDLQIFIYSFLEDSERKGITPGVGVTAKDKNLKNAADIVYNKPSTDSLYISNLGLRVAAVGTEPTLVDKKPPAPTVTTTPAPKVYKDLRVDAPDLCLSKQFNTAAGNFGKAKSQKDFNNYFKDEYDANRMDGDGKNYMLTLDKKNRLMLLVDGVAYDMDDESRKSNKHDINFQGVEFSSMIEAKLNGFIEKAENGPGSNGYKYQNQWLIYRAEIGGTWFSNPQVEIMFRRKTDGTIESRVVTPELREQGDNEKIYKKAKADSKNLGFYAGGKNYADDNENEALRVQNVVKPTKIHFNSATGQLTDETGRVVGITAEADADNKAKGTSPAPTSGAQPAENGAGNGTSKPENGTSPTPGDRSDPIPEGAWKPKPPGTP